MTWISKTVILFGAILLAHACYSAQEHSALQAFRFSSHHAYPLASIPLDIIIETIVATFVICTGLALGTQPLRPILWREWAGKIEREGAEGFTDADGVVSREYVGNPFAVLEAGRRPGFWDIRAERKKFAAWMKGAEGFR